MALEASISIKAPRIITDSLQFGTGITSQYGWQDIIGDITVKAGGTNPTWTLFSPKVGAYGFAVGDECDLVYHLPHDYAPGTDLYIHAHWSHKNATISGNIQWNVFAIYAKGHGQEPFPTSDVVVPIGRAVTIGACPQYQHMVTEVQLSAPNGLISFLTNVSITTGTAILTAAAPLFEAWEVGRTVRVVGAGVAGGDLNTTILTFTSTTQVTLAATASTTVTLQPNYRHRVLDTSLIEVDGIIATNLTMVLKPTGPTVIHTWTSDIHYQSTGTATKNKSPNFYV